MQTLEGCEETAQGEVIGEIVTNVELDSELVNAKSEWAPQTAYARAKEKFPKEFVHATHCLYQVIGMEKGSRRSIARMRIVLLQAT